VWRRRATIGLPVRWEPAYRSSKVTEHPLTSSHHLHGSIQGVLAIRKSRREGRLLDEGVLLSPHRRLLLTTRHQTSRSMSVRITPPISQRWCSSYAFSLDQNERDGALRLLVLPLFFSSPPASLSREQEALAPPLDLGSLVVITIVLWPLGSKSSVVPWRPPAEILVGPQTGKVTREGSCRRTGGSQESPHKAEPAL
jgi:hypothetical protein